MTSKSRSEAASLVIFVTTATCLIAFCFSQIVPHLTLDAVMAAVKLLGTTALLGLLGSGPAQLCFGRRRAASRSRELAVELPLAVALGQVVIILYVYLRALLQRGFAAFLDSWVPVTGIELLALCLLSGIATFVLSRRSSLPLASSNAWTRCKTRQVSNAIVVFLALSGMYLFMAARELPRDVSLSSDPDQHAFWAYRIAVQGGVLWDLGEWGPLDPNYPEGFAVLAFSWSSLSGLSPVETVTILPLVQTQLAILMIAGYVARRRQLRADHRACVILSGLLVYYCVLPHGHQSLHYYLSGTARISILLVNLLAGCLIARLCTRAEPHRPTLLAILAGTLAVHAFFNPALLIAPGVGLALGALYHIAPAQFRRRADVGPPLIPLWQRGLIAFQSAAAVVVVLAALLSLDPYYFHLASGRSRPMLDASHAALPSWFQLLFHAFLNIPSQMSAEALGRVVDVDLLGRAKFSVVLGIPALALFRAVIAPRDGARQSLRSLALWVLPLMVVVVSIPVGAALATVTNVPQLALLYPYFQHSVAQLCYLWLFFAILSTAAAVLRWSRSRSRSALAMFAPPALLCVILTGAWLARPSILRPVRLSPRAGRCGSLGCVTENDRKVIAWLEEKYSEFQTKAAKSGPDGSESAATPRVLVASNPVTRNGERWLFPYGGARYLATRPSFPLAFYYFQGSPAFSYENYIRHVCETLDREWLRSQNVQFIFLPEEQEGVCIPDVSGLGNATITTVQVGEARVLRLF